MLPEEELDDELLEEELEQATVGHPGQPLLRVVVCK